MFHIYPQLLLCSFQIHTHFSTSHNYMSSFKKYFNNSLTQICAVHIFLYVRLSTRAWPTYQEPYPSKKLILLLLETINFQYLFSYLCDLIAPFPLNATLLTALILDQSCAEDYICYEFMSTEAMLCPEDTIKLCFSLIFGFYNFSTPSSSVVPELEEEV